MPPAPTRKTQGVNAVERALTLLDAFVGDGSRGLAELAKATALAKPTALRLLVSLERLGYVVRLSDGRYQLGAKVMQLGATYRSNFRLDQHVLPVLQRLAEATRESAAFHIREKNSRLCLFRVESPQAVRDFQRPAALVALDSTSTGQVLKTAAWPGLDDGRGTLVFASARVYDTQTASVSTAVFGAGQALAGALTVSGPAERFTADVIVSVADELVQAARGLSSVLGAPMPPVSAPPSIQHLSAAA
ncbi:IclR family transcriptional regulator [Limobrevibacterium gyesilva]|uniref:Helix-turn-helix domain-containing protein n=1 Tax=Limobrevibacterium gyesilva TaxID=2991712 RepID=A0AA41YJ68_9PROT|nr:helix-turn-helix domain-containing protein [Limobrevibacterium gyesilva]MCW3474659.1 helix-turn-helix domain-containing protein [Limobrevibacterium gyesilva]